MQLPPEQTADLRQLEADLIAAGFTMQATLERLGPAAFAALGRGHRTPAMRAVDIGPQDTLGTAIRLFLLAEALPEQDVASLTEPARLLALGLAARTLGVVNVIHPSAQIRPYPHESGDVYVVSDIPATMAIANGDLLEPEHVVGVGGASVTLATLTPRRLADRLADRVFDLGTGCGIQAVLAARHASQVIATDTNPRALRFAAMSAALSGLEVDLRQGSLFDPVGGDSAPQTFDLIVANPPFVIGPASRFTYRDSPLPADDLGRTVVRRAAQHLAPGGIAVILANWLLTGGQAWADRPGEWLAGSPCDSWVALRDTQDLPGYIEMWLADSAERHGAEMEARYREWLRVLEDWGATGIGFGWIVLRRPEGPPSGGDSARSLWRHVEDLQQAPRIPAGEEVLRQVGWFDSHEAADAAQLMTSQPRWSSGVVIDRTSATDPPNGRPAEGSDVRSSAMSLEARRVGGPDWRPPEPLDESLVRILGSEGPLVDRISDDEELVGALVGIRRLIRAGLVELA